MDFSPEEQECPACQYTLKERYHKQRWVMRRDQHVNVVSHVLEGRKTACTRQAVVYRPPQDDALAWRGDSCGRDVVARRGAWRYRHNWSMTKMRDQLQTESHLSRSLQEVALLCEVFLALVTTVAYQDAELIGPWRTVAGIVLALDGVQPEKSHETLAIVRDVCSGRV